MSLDRAPFFQRRLGMLRNLATAAVVLASGVYLLAPPIARLVHSGGIRVGLEVATGRDSVVDVRGGEHPLLAPDSATFLVFLNATCSECRMNAKSYIALANWAAIQGAAVRLLLPNDLRATSQFGRLAGAELTMRMPKRDWYEQLGIPETPSILLLDQKGIIRARWLGQVPTHLAALNALGRLDRSMSAPAAGSVQPSRASSSHLEHMRYEPMNTPRRGFLTQLSVSALALIGAPPILRAMSNGTVRQSPTTPEPWLDGLVGKHKQFFDVAAAGAGAPLLRAASFMDAYGLAYGLADSDLTVVFGAHGSGLGFVLGDRSWSAYRLGARFSIEDPTTRKPAVQNVFSGLGSSAFVPSVVALQKRGVRFLACRQSIARLSRDLAAQDGLSQEMVQTALLADVLPGVIPVPAMIVAANRAQESGLTYVYVG